MSKIEFFKNTGFNNVDVPASIAMLRQKFSVAKTVNGIEIIQSDFIAYVTIDDIAANLARQFDYAIVNVDNNETAYCILSYQFTSPGVCRFYLQLDPYCTIGGLGEESGNTIVSGHANRLSVNLDEEDTTFFELPEPFQPAERFRIDHDILVWEAVQPIQLMESVTIPPDKKTNIIPASGNNGIVQDNMANITEYYDASVSGQATTKTMTAGNVTGYNQILTMNPAVRSSSNTTVITLKNPVGDAQIDCNTYYWCNNIKSVVQAMRTVGRDDDITAYWEVPGFYITLGTDSGYTPSGGTSFGLASISAKLHNDEVEDVVTVPYDNNIINHKAKYGQGTIVKIYCPASGDQLDKSVSEILNADVHPASENLDARYYVTADIRPGGTPIFGWYFKNGDGVAGITPECVRGSAWRNISLAATGMSNSDLAQAQLNAAQAQENRGGLGGVVGNYARGMESSYTKGAQKFSNANKPIWSKIWSGIGSVFGKLKNATAEFQSNFNADKQNDQQELLNRESINASQVLLLGNSSWGRDVNLNVFVVMISRYSTNDMKAFDDFLTLYGYNVGNKPISPSDFDSRPYFNYVRVNDIDIKLDDEDLYMANAVREQLKAGIRIWHRQPTEAAITFGNKPGDEE